MTTIPLYQIADAYAAVAEALVENNGELTPEIQAQLDALEGQFTEKVERCALYIRNLLATAEAATGEARRLQDLAGRRTNAADRLKGYVKMQMEIAGVPKVETALIVARIQKSPPSAKYEGEVDALPAAYQRVTVAFNARAAIDAAKAGTPLPAGVSVEQHTHLRLS